MKTAPGLGKVSSEGGFQLRPHACLHPSPAFVGGKGCRKREGLDQHKMSGVGGWGDG